MRPTASHRRECCVNVRLAPSRIVSYGDPVVDNCVGHEPADATHRSAVDPMVADAGANPLCLMSLFSCPPPGVDSQADGGGGHRDAGDQTSNAVSWHDEGDECE